MLKTEGRPVNQIIHMQYAWRCKYSGPLDFALQAMWHFMKLLIRQRKSPPCFLLLLSLGEKKFQHFEC